MLDIAVLRQQFPALQRRPNGRTPLFLDGPGGTQVPQRVIDAMTHYLTTCNANHGGVFTTSRESDRILHDAHQAVADLLNAPSADEIVFGQNMTSLTFHLSRSLAKTWKAGDEILVTRLDHDANVSPWVLAARDAGATVKMIDIRPEDCTLDLDDLRRQLSPRTKLLAVSCASNAVGTINDVKQLGQWAHDAGALIYLDAVHYAPHGPIDVQDWNCDFLAYSAYKFFGPHVGILWGRRSLLESLSPYKVRPASEIIPDRWMTGTQNHEGLAGVIAAMEYLASLQPELAAQDRRSRLRANLKAIREYEATLSRRLLEGLAAIPRFRVWGITDLKRLHERVPTVSLTSDDSEWRPWRMAQYLAYREVYTWHGNFYALNLTERLGLEQGGGLLRLGLVHYNTEQEVDRLLQILNETRVQRALSDDSDPRKSALDRCRYFDKHFRAGRITFQEYASNITDVIIYGYAAEIPACVEFIPREILEPYADYLRDFLEPIDFKHYPGGFLIGPVSEAEIEEAKQLLRPKYLRLYEAVRAKLP